MLTPIDISYIADIMQKSKPYYLVYEDSYIIVIVKEHGVYVIPDRAAVEQNILIDLLRADFGSNILVCHRLDAGTGGVMIVAKTPTTHKILSADFENNVIEKYYTAVTENKISDQTLILPIAKSNHGKFNINFKSGKKAITSFITATTNSETSVILCRLYTGRTHQIRVHLKALKAPLYQDFLYNKTVDDKRLTLFADKIVFHHPVTKVRLEFTAPLSDFMKNTIRSVELNNKI